MASTIPLSKTVDITKRFIYNSPLFFVNDGDLAFSIGDWVRQFLLSPPFAWRWNRSEMGLVVQPGKTDYTVPIRDFGWLERAWILFPANDNPLPLQSKELTIVDNIVAESVLGQPAFVSVIGDDNNGNITFRLMGAPDQPYTFFFYYQRAPLNFTKANQTWDPIPDYYSYLLNQGFLAKAYEYKGDERFAFAYQQFLSLVMAACEGMSETQRNIFAQSFLNTQREAQNNADAVKKSPR